MENSSDFYSSDETDGGRKRIDIEDLLERFKIPIFIFLTGLIVVGVGVLVLRGGFKESNGVEVIQTSEALDKDNLGEIIVEVSGAVMSPGVYKLPPQSRIEDALLASGGLSEDADRELIEKIINRAAKVADGQKLYIPRANQQSRDLTDKNIAGGDVLSENNSGLVNINTANLKELDSLPGIGQVYGQKIIDNRPYSDILDLINRGIIKSSVYEKIKNKVSVY